MSLTQLTRSALDSTAPGDGLPTRAWRREKLAQELDGDWRFHYCPDLAYAPEDCHETGYDDSSWDQLSVPSHWVLVPGHPYGRPSYTNIQLPIPMEPPFTPDDNGIGDYRKSFEIPEHWPTAAQLRLRFDGVESIAIVHVNGQFVGVVRGSRLPTELDITDHVQPGVNLLHVRVAQFSAQTYVEDQDQWWLPGIFREVTVVARQPNGIEDYWISADYDSNSGHGKLCAELVGGFPVILTVPELGFEVVWPSANEISPLDVGQVSPWSPDSPTLYRAKLSNAVETIETRIGFRTIQLDGNQWLVNGTKVRLRGVNRHEFHPAKGRVFDEEDALAGLREMKRANITAIRTAHYPPHPRVLELADELGFWVIDECDLETHAFTEFAWESNPCDDPTWRAALLQRMRKMVLRDRNHPCIIAWSLGNESGTGANLAAMAQEARRIDPTRPIHYEGDYEGAYTDLVSRMYTSPLQMTEISAGRSDASSARPAQSSRLLNRPKLLCEFAHAMGNGAGAVDKYLELFESLPDWHGGFIWEWRDHGLLTSTEDGTAFYAYGGDFQERNHDGNFVMDGLILADGTPSPMLSEVKQLFSPVVIDIVDEKLTVENRYHAISTTGLRFRWSWEVSGITQASGELTDLAVPAGQRVTFPLPELPVKAKTQRDSFLTITVEEREDLPWAAAGHVIYRYQHRLDNAPVPLLPPPVSSLTQAFEEVLRLGPVELCPRTGRVLTLSGVPVLDSGVELWRAPTDNDRLGAFASYELSSYHATLGLGQYGPSALQSWLAAGLNRLMRRSISMTVEKDQDIVVVERLLAAQSRHGAEVSYRWRKVAGGTACQISVAPIRPLSDVTWPRIGFHMALAENFTTARWFGGGPGESYPDSRAAVIVGDYAAAIDELSFPYARPQENGHREQLRRLELSGPDSGLRFETFGPDLPGFSLSRHDAYELSEANHQHELPKSSALHLYFDAAQHGLGSRACGPDVLPEHQLWPRAAQFGFVLLDS